MKKILFRLMFIITLCMGLSSCNFLDVVPDEIPGEEDAFASPAAALRYVYSCYAYLPNSRDAVSSLDLETGDEVVTAFEHEAFAAFPKGNYSSSNPVISYWNTLFQGLRQCYIFLDNIDSVPRLKEEVKQDYIGQVKFLIGYYHFLLMRCYGPTIIIDKTEDMNILPEDYKARSTYQETINVICDYFDAAATTLPARRKIQSEYGLATSTAALALKAKTLMYAASPLYNSDYYANTEIADLMPSQADPKKWELCRDAMKKAIDAAEAAGFKLYERTDAEENMNKYPSDPTQRCLRYTIMDPGNDEIIFAETRDEGYYGIQNKAAPFSSESDWCWNGIAPTWNMLNRFYTKNGLPWSVDPETKDLNMFAEKTIPASMSEYAAEGESTLEFNLHREPRFYSWIVFQNSYFEIQSASTNGAYGEDPSFADGRMKCDFILGGNCSRRPSSATELRTTSYSPTGYLNKKGVLPSFAVKTGGTNHTEYPWPIVRLADLYLGYAEACVETGDLDEAKKYLNKVRARAGIPTVEKSWEEIAKRELNQSLLRDIVRNERMVELYFENQNFWDMRRWLLAGDHKPGAFPFDPNDDGVGYFNQKVKGLDITAESFMDFAKIIEVDFERKFESPRNYLLPIPNKDVNTNMNLVNNPGY